MTVPNKFSNESYCCNSPAIQLINSFYTCTNCGTVISQKFVSEQKFFEIGTDNKKISRIKMRLGSQQYYTRTEKFLLGLPGLAKSLRLYRSIPDKRILSGFPTRIIAAALGIVACETDIARNEMFTLQEIYQITHAVHKIECEKSMPHTLVQENFMFQILAGIQRKSDRKVALKIFREYYEQLLRRYDRLNRLNVYIFLTKNLVIPKNFAFWVKIAARIIHTQIPVIIQKKYVPTDTINNLASKVIEFLKLKIPIPRSNFLMNLMRLIQNVTTENVDNRDCATGSRSYRILDCQKKRRNKKCTCSNSRQKIAHRSYCVKIGIKNCTIAYRSNSYKAIATAAKSTEVLGDLRC